MTRLPLALLFACGLVTVGAPARAAPGAMRHVAVLVGANAPPPGLAALRFAQSDATELAGVLEQVGGFAPDDVHVLLDPHPAELLAVLDGVRERAGGDDTLFVFYYSGHSDGQAIFPHGEPLPLAAVRERLDHLGARIRVGILDTCRGGSWTQSKGLTVGPPLTAADLLNVDTEGTALVSSSSGFEDAHEADAVRGSFFTHHFAAGLRGAADREGDGNVTLQEAFDYARDRTVRDSVRLAQAPQHPSFDLALRGRQDIVLATLPAAASALQITAAQAPLEVIQLPSGITVAEAPAGLQPVRIALPPGRYLVRRIVDGRVYAREVEVHAGETASLGDGALEAVASEQLAVKGLDLAPSALVHIEGRGPIVLEVSERNGPWSVACMAPCDRDLPLSATYRLDGPGIRSSNPFQLEARAGERVDLHPRTASNLGFVSGIVLAGLGTTAVGAGALIVGTQNANDNLYPQSTLKQNDGARPSSGPSKAVGEGLMVGGAVGIVGGVVLLIESLHSKVEQGPMPAPPPQADAWLRTPMWHEDPIGTGFPAANGEGVTYGGRF